MGDRGEFESPSEALRVSRASRALTGAVAAFYVGFGAWALLAPGSFFDLIAPFQPYNVHLFHDAGAFQVGLGLALLVPLALRAPLRAANVAVLAASLLHLGAHLVDLRRGGHPGTDLPFLSLVCLALVAAIALERRGEAERRR
jgi:hypothetical protein